MPSSLSFFDEGSSLTLALRSLDPLHFFIFRVRALDTVSLEPSNIVVQGFPPRTTDTFWQKIARTQVATRGNTMMMQRRHVALSAWLGDCDKQDTSHEHVGVSTCPVLLEPPFQPVEAANNKLC